MSLAAGVQHLPKPLEGTCREKLPVCTSSTSSVVQAGCVGQEELKAHKPCLNFWSLTGQGWGRHPAAKMWGQEETLNVNKGSREGRKFCRNFAKQIEN